MRIPQISVNVADMTKDDIISSCLLAPVIKNKTIINCEPKRIDGMAVVLDCNHDQAMAIRDVIRMKYGKNEFRVYEGKKRI